MRYCKFPLILALSLLASCSNQETPSNKVDSNPPIQLGIQSGKDPLVAGLCSSENIVSLYDKDGNISKVSYDQTFRLTSSSQFVSFYLDSECKNQTRAVKIAANSTQGRFYVKMSRPEYVTYIVSGNNYSAAAESKTAISPNASRLNVIGPESVQTGLCSGKVTVETYNYKGEKSEVTEDVTVQLSGNGLGKFYLNEACSGDSVSSVIVPTGSAETGIYFKTTKTNAYNLVFTAPGPVAANIVLNATSGAPAKMVYSNSPKSVVAGSCSDNYVIEFLDQLNNVTTLREPKEFLFSGQNLKFYNSPGCGGQAVSGISATSGQSSITFYVKPEQASTDNLAVSGFGEERQTITVLPSSPSRLRFSSIQSQATAGLVFDRIKVNIEDSFGNITGSTKKVFLSAFKDSECKISATNLLNGISSTNAISGQASFSTISYNKSENIYILAFSDGIAPVCSGQVAVKPDFPTKLGIIGPSGVAVNSCNKITVSPIDVFGNISPVDANTQVTIGLFGNGSFFSDSQCLNSISNQVSLPATQESIELFFKDATIQDLNIRFTGVGSSPSFYPIKVVAADASNFNLNIPSSVTAGVCASGFLIRTVDEFGNESAVKSDQLFNFQLGSGKIYTDRDCTNQANDSITLANGQSTKQFFYKNTTSGVFGFNFSGLQNNIGKQINVIPGEGKRIILNYGPASVSTSPISGLSAKIVDNFGNTAKGSSALVTLNAYRDPTCLSPSSGQLTGTTAKAAILGELSFDNVLYSKSEQLYLYPEGTGLATSCFGPVNILPGQFEKLSISPIENITAGSCSKKISVTLTDANGNSTTSDQDQQIFVSGLSSAKIYMTQDCSGQEESSSFILAAGQNKLDFYIRDTVAENINVFSGVSGAQILSETRAVVVSPGVPKKLGITGQSLIEAQSCSSAYSIRIEDEFGNLTKADVDTNVQLSLNGSATVYGDSACSQPESSKLIREGSSTSSVYLKGQIAETFSFSASAGNQLDPNVLNNVRIAALGPTKIKLFGQTSLVAGQCVPYTLTTIDVFGNVSEVSADTSFPLSQLGSGQAYLSNNCSGSPVASVKVLKSTSSSTFYYKNNFVGNYNIKATGFSSASDQIGIFVSNAPLNKISFITEPKSVVAGSCSSEVRIESQDEFGNSYSPATDIHVQLSGQNVSFFEDSLCSIPLDQNSSKIVVGSSIKGFYFSSTKTSANSILVTASFNSVSQVITVSPSVATKLLYTKVPTSGSPNLVSSFLTPIEVMVSDQYDNLVTAATDSITVESYLDSSCQIQTAFSSFVGEVTKPASSGVSTFSPISYNYPETIYVRANSPRLGSICSSPIVISDSTPTSIRLSGEAQIPVGVCQDYKVNAISAYDTPALLAIPLQFSITTNPEITLYNDLNCTQPLTPAEQNIAIGSTDKTFWIKESKAKTELITATSFVGQDTKEVLILPLAPTIVGLGEERIFVNQCNEISIQKQDLFGNPSASSAEEVVEIETYNAGQVYSDADCLNQVSQVIIAENEDRVKAYYKNVNHGQTHITLTGMSVENDIPILVSRPDPKNIIFGENVQSPLPAGQCAPVEIITADSFRTPVVVDVDYSFDLLDSSLSEDPVSGFYADSGCSGQRINSATMAAGTDRKTIYLKVIKSGDFFISTNKLNVNSDQKTIAILAGPVFKLDFASAPTTIISKNTELSLNIAFFDQFGNIVKSRLNSQVTVSLLSATDLTDQSSVLEGTSFSAFPNTESGVATIPGLIISASGRFKFKATDGTYSKISDTETFVAAESILGTKITDPVSTGARSSVVLTEKDLIFGSPDEEGCGTVNVYKETSADRAAPNYVFSQKIKPLDCQAGSKFGKSISAYGPYLIIGSPGYVLDSGRAYLFIKNPSSGLYYNPISASTDLIISSTNSAGDLFGSAVSISGDYFVVASPGKLNGSGQAKVYSYSRDLSTITLTQTLNPIFGTSGDKFGTSLGIYSGFGNDRKNGFIAVGSPGKSSGSGEVTVFRLNSGLFVEPQTLPPSGSPAIEEGSRFGESLSIFGPYLAVGAPNSVSGKGKAFVYKNINPNEFWMNTGTNNWGSESQLSADGLSESASFGKDIKIFGNYIIVGSPNSQGINIGSAFIFEKNKNEQKSIHNQQSWTNLGLINSEFTDPDTGDALVFSGFGNYVAIYDNKIAVSSSEKGFVSYSSIDTGKLNVWPFGFDGPQSVSLVDISLKNAKYYDFSSLSVDLGKNVNIDSSSSTGLEWTVIGSRDDISLNGQIIGSSNTRSGYKTLYSPDEYGISYGKIIGKGIISSSGGKGGSKNGTLGSSASGMAGGAGSGGTTGGAAGKNGELIFVKTNSNVTGTGSVIVSGTNGGNGSSSPIVSSIDNVNRVITTGTCSLFQMSFSRKTAGSCYSNWTASPLEYSTLGSSSSRFSNQYNSSYDVTPTNQIKFVKNGTEDIYHVFGTGFYSSDVSGWNTEEDPDCIKLLKAGFSTVDYPGTSSTTVQTTFGQVNFSSCSPQFTAGTDFLCDENGFAQQSYSVKFVCNYASGDTVYGCSSGGGGGGAGGSGGNVVVHYSGTNSIGSSNVLFGEGQKGLGGVAASPSSCISSNGQDGENGKVGSYEQEKVSSTKDIYVSNSLSCSITNGSGTKTWNGTNYSDCSQLSCQSSNHLIFGSCEQNSQVCFISNGSGTKSWNTSNSSFGDCSSLSCSTGYEFVNGACSRNCLIDEHRNSFGVCEKNEKSCVALHSTFAKQTWNQSTQTFGSCNISECDQNYHLLSNSCVSNTRGCSISNGSGIEFWNKTSGSYNGCKAFACNSGFHQEAGLCSANKKSCFVQNGTGEETWVPSTGTYSSCSPTGCNPNYEIKNNSCSPKTIACSSAELPQNALSATKTFNGVDYGSCTITECNSGYLLVSSINSCYRPTVSNDSYHSQEGEQKQLNVTENDTILSGVSGLTNQINIISGQYLTTSELALSFVPPNSGYHGMKTFLYEIVSSYNGFSTASNIGEINLEICQNGSHFDSVVGSCVKNLNNLIITSNKDLLFVEQLQSANLNGIGLNTSSLNNDAFSYPAGSIFDYNDQIAVSILRDPIDSLETISVSPSYLSTNLSLSSLSIKRGEIRNSGTVSVSNGSNINSNSLNLVKHSLQRITNTAVYENGYEFIDQNSNYILFSKRNEFYKRKIYSYRKQDGLVSLINLGNSSKKDDIISPVSGKIGESIFFIGLNDKGNQKLYSTNGVSTLILKDYNGADSSDFAQPNLIELGQNLYYVIFSQSTSQYKIYRYDGINDINVGTFGSEANIGNFVMVGSTVYFNYENVELSGEIGQDAFVLMKITGNSYEPLSSQQNFYGPGGASFAIKAGNNFLYFAEKNQFGVWKLRRTNGTETFSVTNSNESTTDLISSNLIEEIGSSVYFVGYNENGALKLYRSDGVNYFQVSNGSGSDSINDQIGEITASGQYVYFSSRGNGFGLKLFRTDGTACSGSASLVCPGTVQVSNTTNSNSIDDNPTSLTPVNGNLYFIAESETGIRTLYKTNGSSCNTGTCAGTGSIISSSAKIDDLFKFDRLSSFISFSSENNLYSYDDSSGTLYPIVSDSSFTSDTIRSSSDSELIYAEKNNSQLFKWTPQSGKLSLNNLQITLGMPDGINFADSVSDGTNLYFVANNEYGAKKLYKYNGTSLVRISNTRLNQHLSDEIFNLAVVGSRVLFVATDFTGNPKLYSSDGTPDGTIRLTNFRNKSIDFSPISSKNLNYYKVIGDIMYFRAFNEAGLTKLFKTDGLTVSAIAETNSLAHDDPANFVSSGGSLYYSSSIAFSSRKLFKYNGSTVTQVSDIRGENSDSIASVVAAGQNVFFYSFNSAGSGFKLFKTTGTLASTVQVSNIAGENSDGISNITAIGDEVYFMGEGGVYRNTGQACSSTCPGNILVSTAKNGKGFVSDGTNVYFIAAPEIDQSGSPIDRIFKTTGTLASTVQVADNNRPGNLYIHNSNLYFSALNSSGSSYSGTMNLFKTDGSECNGATLGVEEKVCLGRTQISNFSGSPDSGSIGFISNIGNVLYYSGYDQQTDSVDLYKLTGQTSLKVTNGGIFGQFIGFISTNLYFSSPVAGKLYKFTEAHK